MGKSHVITSKVNSGIPFKLAHFKLTYFEINKKYFFKKRVMESKLLYSPLNVPQ